MKSGERALVHVGWELAYGKDGNFSFPNVPPMADLLYEVEVIGFDETKEASFLLYHHLWLIVSLPRQLHNQALSQPICLPLT